MFELSNHQFHLVRSLFSSLTHNRSIVFSVLEGNSPGRIFVDDLSHPQTTFLLSCTEFNFLAGEPDNNAFNSQLKARLETDLRPTSPYLLLFPVVESWKSVIDQHWGDLPGEWANRLEYDFVPSPGPGLDNWHTSIPNGYSVLQYGAQLATTAPGLVEFWFSLDKFLANGFGFAVLHNGEPVSRCHTVVVGDRLAEISIETEEAFRRKGLAQLAVRAFLDHCQKVGLQPHWSCWDFNQPSQSLAQKLGFGFKEKAPVRVIFLKEVKNGSA